MNKKDINLSGTSSQKRAQQNVGHRSRLRQRFEAADPRALPDYEILEMLLFHVIPRCDTKEIAKTLLQHFGSLAAVIAADKTELHMIAGVGETVSGYIRLLSDLFSRLYLPVNKKTNVLSSWLAVINYCQFTMGFKRTESFRVLFLNKKNAVTYDAFFDTGTIDKINIYPREIVRQALVHAAASVILVHNHPSGDPAPSKEDITITQKIAQALNTVCVQLHDHLIVAQDKHFSFKANNLI